MHMPREGSNYNEVCSFLIVLRVVETQNDYAIKALVNTVDHLGSVIYEVTEFVDEKVDQRDWDSPSNAKEVDEENQPSLVEKDKSCKRLLE
ncbi:hypothetical protein Bca101_069000 [Brassica carinata]